MPRAVFLWPPSSHWSVGKERCVIFEDIKGARVMNDALVAGERIDGLVPPYHLEVV